MSLRLPFDMEVMSEMLGGSTLVLSKNNAYSSLYIPINEVVLNADGTASGVGKWEITDGVLRLCDKDGGLLYEFRSLETKNNCVYMVGRSVLESSVNGILRVTLHKKSVISTTDFGICVSSHIDYEKDTLSRLFKSLNRDGFNMGNIFVVVGGDTKTAGKIDVDPEYNVKILRQRQNLMGFTAFSVSSEFEPLQYWLLLHDTCEVVGGFYEKMKTLDIGLNPDIILFGDSKDKFEMGMYSKNFLRNCGLVSESTKSEGLLDIMISRASVVVVLNSIVKKEAERDIYGTGNKRETILFNSLGIKKFKGKAVSGGKP